MDNSIRIKEIVNTLVHNYVFVSDYYKAKARVKLTNAFLDSICSEIVKQSLVYLVDILDDKKRSDDIRIDYSKYSEKTQKAFSEFCKKYKKFRNKRIAHVTATEIQVAFSLVDWITILSHIHEADVRIAEGGLTPFFEQILLAGK